MSIANLPQNSTESNNKFANSTAEQTTATDSLLQLCLRHCSCHVEHPLVARVAVAAHDQRENLFHQLELVGFSDLVDVFEDASPMNSIRSLMPDLILLHLEPQLFRRKIDWRSPPRSLDVLSALKADPQTSCIPAIAITNEIDTEQLQRAVLFGADEVVSERSILPQT